MDKYFGDTELLKGSLPKEGVVGIYLSAHWCPPCRGFTPKLAESYKKIKATGKLFEVVFVSSDRDQASFDEYFAEMPWLALPFEKREEKDKLSKKFKVSGIPMFILLDAKTGAVITKDGRSALMKDPEGAKYPWTPPTLAETLGDTFIGKSKSEQSVKDKIIGLYFSAHWCGPCRNFTPKLVETYNKVRAKRDDFEVIFVSADRDEKQFEEYFGTMPWLALPYDDRDKADALNEIFGVEGIPTFVLIDKDGSIISKDGSDEVRGDPEGKDFPWRPAPVRDLERAGGALNEQPALVAFTDGCAEGAARDAVAAAVLAVAEEERARRGADGEDEDEVVFCVSSSAQGQIGGQVRKLCQTAASPAAGDGAKLALLDIPDKGAYYVLDPAPAGPLDAAAVRAFLAGYRAKALERRQLK